MPINNSAQAFDTIRAVVAGDYKVSQGALRVLCLLLLSSDADLTVETSCVDLAQRLDRHPSTMQVALRSLQAAGVLTVVKRIKGGKTVYKIAQLQ